MRVLSLAMPALAGLALVNAQGLPFSQIVSQNPGVTTIQPTPSGPVDREATASAIISYMADQYSSSYGSSLPADISTEETAAEVSTSTSIEVSTSPPDVTTPAVTTPAATTPAVTLPAVTTPVVTTPAITTPAFTPPAVTTPAVTTPKLPSAPSAQPTTLKTSSIRKKKHHKAAKKKGKAHKHDKEPTHVKHDEEPTLHKRQATSSASTSSVSPSSPCTPQTYNFNYVGSNNSAAGFLVDQTLANAALNAVTPPGYSNIFNSLNGSMYAPNYLGYYQLSFYDTVTCAAYCSAVSSCVSFNIYFERDPSLAPGVSCPSPSAIVSARCALYGSYIAPSQALNLGQWRSQFQLLVTASSGYWRDQVPAALPGYSNPAPQAGLINIYSLNGYNPFVGYNFYSGGYNASQCTSLCVATTAQNRAYAQQNGISTYQPCNWVDAVLVSVQGTMVGTYCAMYNTSLVAGISPITSQPLNGVTYTISNSYGFAISPPDPGNFIVSSSSTSATTTVASSTSTTPGVVTSTATSKPFQIVLTQGQSAYKWWQIAPASQGGNSYYTVNLTTSQANATFFTLNTLNGNLQLASNGSQFGTIFASSSNPQNSLLLIQPSDYNFFTTPDFNSTTVQSGGTTYYLLNGYTPSTSPSGRTPPSQSMSFQVCNNYPNNLAMGIGAVSSNCTSYYSIMAYSS